MKQRKVYIVEGNAQYTQMFTNEGFEVVAGLADDPDLVCFTGGADVDPELYGEDVHPTTHYNRSRDDREIAIYNQCLDYGIPMVGICRGGQFLNVMNGGSMYQHVDGHAISGTHSVVDVLTHGIYECTSTHHQMMVPDEEGEVLAVASEASFMEFMHDGSSVRVEARQRGEDVEAVAYWDTLCLCFQPHPEFPHAHDCRGYFFTLLSDLFTEKGE